MNQKSLRYFLLAAVVLIWGIIIYRVFNGLNDNESIKPARKKIAPLVYNHSKDSFLLLANYSDPFISQAIEIDKPLNDVQSFVMETTLNNNPASDQKKSEFDTKIIQYHGMISNPDTKIKLAVITFRGNEYNAKEGDRIEQVRIRKITKNDIVILAEGKSYTISIKSN